MCVIVYCVCKCINSWSVVNQNGKPIYTVEFHDAQNKPVSIALDAKTGIAVK